MESTRRSSPFFPPPQVRVRRRRGPNVTPRRPRHCPVRGGSARSRPKPGRRRRAGPLRSPERPQGARGGREEKGRGEQRPGRRGAEREFGSGSRAVRRCGSSRPGLGWGADPAWRRRVSPPGTKKDFHRWRAGAGAALRGEASRTAEAQHPQRRGAARPGVRNAARSARASRGQRQRRRAEGTPEGPENAGVGCWRPAGCGPLPCCLGAEVGMAGMVMALGSRGTGEEAAGQQSRGPCILAI